MYWIVLPSLFIWLFYISTVFYSESIFSNLHAYDNIKIFGFEISLESSISNLEWFYFLIVLEIFKFVILTLLSPFNAYISELYDKKKTGHQFEFSFERLLTDLLRGFMIALTGFSIELLLSGFWLLFALFLPIESLSPLFFLSISSFFFGFAYLDYSLERYQFNFGQSWKYALKNFKSCFLIGLIFSLFMMIPHLGIILAPPLITLFATEYFIAQNS